MLTNMRAKLPPQHYSMSYLITLNAQAFCALRSVISTARKQSYRVVDILTEVTHVSKSLGRKLTDHS